MLQWRNWARLCHCLNTGFPPPRFHFSQLAQLPFEWPVARLSINFSSVAASFSQNVSRMAVERTLLITKVLENLPRLDLEDAVTVDQSVGDAIRQEIVSVGSTCHNTTQKFSTLVLRAGRTTLPSLQVQARDTPLTQQGCRVI